MFFLQVIYVPDLGLTTVRKFGVHHVIGPTHHSPTAETAPEAVKDELSNVEKVETGHVLIPKDVRTTLSAVAGLVIEEVVLPTQVGPRVETNKSFAHTVVVSNVKWHNAVFLTKESFLTTLVIFVLSSYFTGQVLIVRLLKITGPPQQ